MLLWLLGNGKLVVCPLRFAECNPVLMAWCGVIYCLCCGQALSSPAYLIHCAFGDGVVDKLKAAEGARNAGKPGVDDVDAASWSGRVLAGDCRDCWRMRRGGSCSWRRSCCTRSCCFCWNRLHEEGSEKGVSDELGDAGAIIAEEMRLSTKKPADFLAELPPVPSINS